MTAFKTGTGYVTVTASANGYDSVSKDVKIVVSKKSLNNGLLTLSETSYVYDGTYKSLRLQLRLAARCFRKARITLSHTETI